MWKADWVPRQASAPVKLQDAGHWLWRCFDSCQAARVEETLVLYNTAISSCEKGSYWQLAVQLIAELQGNTFRPSIITFNAAMSACSKGSQWRSAILAFCAGPEQQCARHAGDILRSHGGSCSRCPVACSFRFSCFVEQEPLSLFGCCLQSSDCLRGSPMFVLEAEPV